MEAPVKVTIRSNWSGAILVCGKCFKKAGGKRRMAKSLRATVGGAKGRKAAIGVIETKCLGICPKRGVVVIDTARPDRWQIVAPDTPADEVLARLAPDQA